MWRDLVCVTMAANLCVNVAVVFPSLPFFIVTVTERLWGNVGLKTVIS